MLACAVLLVELGEALDVARLLAEGANHADPGQRLLEVARDRGDLLPRQPVGVGRGDPERERAQGQDRKREERQQRQVEVEHHQDHDHADQHQPGLEQRRHSVLDELVERLDVVGQPRDDHTGAVARVEADRQSLQVREQLDAEVLERPLADPADEIRLQVGGDGVNHGRDEERDDDPVERGHVVMLDAVVDRELGQWRRRQRRRGRRPRATGTSRSHATGTARAAAPGPRSLRPRPPVARRRRRSSVRWPWCFTGLPPPPRAACGS